MIKYGVLVNNESSDFIVDYAAIDINKEVDDSWIVFPWEEMK